MVKEQINYGNLFLNGDYDSAARQAEHFFDLAKSHRAEIEALTAEREALYQLALAAKRLSLDLRNARSIEPIWAKDSICHGMRSVDELFDEALERK